MLEKIEQVTASVRARIEHSFHMVKNIFGMKTVRAQGWAKNRTEHDSHFGLANRPVAERGLFTLNVQGAS